MAKSRIADILQFYKEELLEDWVREQLADDARRPDLLSESELRQQAAKFLDAFHQAAQSGNLTDVMAPQWSQVREILTDICRNRAQQGFSSSETATFIFSLKPPLFRRLRLEFGEDSGTFADENWAATVLLDELGLFTTEVYHKNREEVIARQQQELLGQEVLRRSEERYRALYEDSPFIYFTLDTRGTVLSVNRFGAEQFGYVPKELIGRPVLDIFHEEDKEGVLRWLGSRLRGPKRHGVWEARKVRKDGSIVWVRENVRVVQNPEGDTVILLTCEDITERKRAEERLAYHAGLLDNMGDAVLATDERFVLTAWNRGAQEMYGWTAGEVLGRNVLEIVPSELTAEQRAEALRELAGTGRHRAELTTYRKDGTPVYAEGVTVALRDERGRISGYLSINRDITQRRQAEQELRKQEKLFRSLSACSPVGVFLTDLQGRCTYTNPRCQAICGFTFEEALGEGWARFVHPEDREWVFEEWSEYARGGHDYSGEFRFWPLHQDARWTHVRSSPLFSDEGELVGHVGTVEDVTERKRAEEALQESNNRIENIFERVTDGFFALDHEWRLVYLNSEVEYVVQRKREELVGKNMWEEFPETEGSTFYREFHRAARERITVNFEEYYPPLETWFEVHAYPSEEGLSVYFRNVTERKRAEKEAETRTHQQALVAELGLRALAETDLLILMDDAVATLAQIIGAEYCNVLELLPDGETLLRAGVGWKDGFVGSATVGTGARFSGRLYPALQRAGHRRRPSHGEQV
jgi:PAS domain S-box-containing protein